MQLSKVSDLSLCVVFAHTEVIYAREESESEGRCQRSLNAVEHFNKQLLFRVAFTREQYPGILGTRTTLGLNALGLYAAEKSR